MVVCVCLTVYFIYNHRYKLPPESVSVAFLGNSMFYFNDFPRFFEQLSQSYVSHQDCCLHGGASIPSLVNDGSGMFPQFQTKNAIAGTYHHKTIYDYGACTPRQLLFGYDASLHDPNYTIHYFNLTDPDRNPCREDDTYRQYMIQKQQTADHPDWDYVIINDNTRDPSRNATRLASLATLRKDYVPWLRATGAVPVFLWTHAYSVESTPTRNMTGLEDIANFTSLTGVGYREYAGLLEQYLPPSQKPRIAPSGLGFLTIYEEEPEVWKTLFHNADHLHASPSGTFLQGCIVHYTLFGKLPDMSHIQTDDDVTQIWSNARMMQHAWDPPNPIPTIQQVKYLYEVCERVANGYIPSTYIDYERGEVAYGVE